jgi:phage terminase small subunit
MKARKKKPGTAKLSTSERVFIDEFLIDCNATAAYRRAYPNSSYETARVAGSRLVAKANIRTELKAAMKARSERTRITAIRVLKELARIAFSDIFDLFGEDGQLAPARTIPLDSRRAIASVKVRKLKTITRTEGKSTVTETEQVVEYKFWSKLDALGKIANHLGLSTEIPPLDSLLMTLPGPLAEAVKTAIVDAQPVKPAA